MSPDLATKAPPRNDGDAHGTTTASGIPLQASYTAEGTPPSAEKPGEYPFTRGIHPDMYRTRLWTMRQYAGLADPAATNARFRSLLSHGQTGLSVAFDLPTQIGLDPDHPAAAADVGVVGVNIATLADMEALFAGIPLDQVSTSMTINATAGILLAMYLAAAENQGVSWDKVSGTLQNDPLKEFVARGTYNVPVAHAMRLAVDVVAFSVHNVPKFNPISVSGYHMREAGCNAVEEVAFAVANARAYLDRAVARGIGIDDVAPRISWIFNTHNDFFEEVAKYRALRRVWATILRDEYHAKDPRSLVVRTHTQTGGSTLTKQQPENNIARASFQALAAVRGGVQSMALSCWDEALAIPTEHAQQIALRTQQIIAHETGVTQVADPLGGSYFVEHLTAEIEKRVRVELATIAALGGAERAVETEYYQKRIADAAYAHDHAVAERHKIVVGVNKFTETVATEPPSLFRPDPDAATKAMARLADAKRKRDANAVEVALGRLEQEARKPDTNLMPAILACVRAYASVGEITGRMAKVFGWARNATLV